MAIRILSLAAVALTAGTVHAGTILETVTRDLNSQKTSTHITMAQDGMMRVEQKPADTFMVFRDDTIFNVNNREKNYTAMDRAAMKRMAEQINPAMKQMQEQMAKMSPEQRAQMEKMMGNRMPGMGKEKSVEVRKTARTGKIGGYSCSYVEKYEDAVMTEELCVVPPGSLKGSQELIDAAKKMSALMQEMLSGIDSPWIRQMADNQSASYDKIGGVPVLSRHYSDGKAVSEMTLKAIRGESIPAAAFDVPAGYTKKDLMTRR